MGLLIFIEMIRIEIVYVHLSVISLQSNIVIIPITVKALMI